MSSELFLLRAPWDLLHDNRIALRQGDAVQVPADAAGPLLFVADRSVPVMVDGRIGWVAEETAFRKFEPSRGPVDQACASLPLPLRAGRPQRLHAADWRKPVELAWPDAPGRPKTDAHAGPADADEGGPETSTAVAYQDLMLRLIGRLQDLERAEGDLGDLWARVYEAWGDPGRKEEAWMSVLVQHAHELRDWLEDVADRPRRLLSRERTLMPVARVQELDTRCMEWLSRQPGETLAARAGPRQRILGLARTTTANTLENRVFRDLLWRSDLAARDYLRLNRTHSATARYREVERYGRHCRALERQMAEIGVARVNPPVQPNFVLLHDDRYRRIHQAWLDLVRQKRRLDESWQWQRRTWAEFCTVCLAAAARCIAGRPPVAASPVFLRTDQQQGRWLEYDDPLVVLMDRNHRWIVEVLGGGTRVGPPHLGGMGEFGASAWLKVNRLQGELSRYVPVWALHPMPGAPGLADLVASAGKAVRRMMALRFPIDGGMVLSSLAEPEAAPVVAEADPVVGIAFGPGDRQLADGLQKLTAALGRLLDPTS